jgi:TonB family protein
MIKWMFFAAAAAAAPVAAACSQTTSQPETPARLIGGSISNADYPPAAVAAGEQGTTAVRIMVSADGTVTGCDVEKSSGSEALDTTSCALITARLRYAPARDAAGVATPSVVRTRIAWRLQTDTPGTPTRFAFQSFWTTFTAQVEGKIVRSCSTHSLGTPSSTVPADICARLFDSFLPWAEQRGGVASLTQVVAFTIAGQSPPPVQPHWGQVLVRADADVTIGPHGGNARCTVTRVERAPDAGPLGPADPCSLSGGGGSFLFEPARDATAPREGRALIATFAERGPAEAR